MQCYAEMVIQLWHKNYHNQQYNERTKNEMKHTNSRPHRQRHRKIEMDSSAYGIWKLGHWFNSISVNEANMKIQDNFPELFSTWKKKNLDDVWWNDICSILQFSRKLNFIGFICSNFCCKCFVAFVWILNFRMSFDNNSCWNC